MNIRGDYPLQTSRERVWAALLASGLLRRATPGCEQLERIGDGAYLAHHVKLTVGVGAISGSHEGAPRPPNIPPHERSTSRGEGV